jgi:ribosomal protein L11 methyltransferase
VALEIEAAEAFGTGHHATTQGCLVALDRLARQGLAARRVADIGGGTGVLAMAAARVWPARAIAGDIEPLATATARLNVAANGLAGRVACVTAAGFRHPRLHAGGPYDLIFANILAGPLRRLAGELARHHAPGGVAILSGILDRQAQGVIAVYRGWGYRPGRTVRIGGWSTLVLARG